MAGAESNGEFKRANFIQTDLLQRFVSRNNFPCKLEKKIPIEEEEEEDIELSLGLSLNGRFGADPERAKKIIRASSISNFMISSGEDDSKSWILSAGYEAALTRTCSLPTETQEERRKRKELQSLRRMEVKRKRLEKLKNVRMVRERVDLERNFQENGDGEVVIPLKGDGVVELNGEIKPPQFSSQGSIGSQGSGGSSGVSDFESQPIGGTSKYTEERSPASAQSPIEQTEQKTDKLVEAVVENPPPPKIAVAGKEVKEAMKNMMADMPCVSTRGDGPNGKRIEGFLYRYRNGEEVKIVCVCHGSSLSPAEFVKHAGGGDVAHPLRHIVINPAPLL